MKTAGAWIRACLSLCFLAGCRPDLGDRESLITGPRVLAVRADPPESRPGAEVTYHLLVASPEGTLTAEDAAWAFCDEAKPLADNASVTSDCLGEDSVTPIEPVGPEVTAATPDDACSTFGPEVSASGDRPHDADVTGGYYQPVRIRTAGTTAFALERLTCNLGDAPASVVSDYLARYLPNRNPTLVSLAAAARGSPLDLGAVPAGVRVTFQLAWTEGDAETYPVFDRESQTLVDHREALRVSWFSTGGQFENDRTGRSEADLSTFTENTWTAPEAAGTVHLWVALRDSRGGMDFASYEVEVVR